MNPTHSKKERLTDAAATLVHMKGFSNTTLADVAEMAKLPLGGIYYYFKTKDALAEAVTERRVSDIDAMLEKLDRLPTPRARLKALVNVWAEDREIDALYGCPIGSLCYELAKGRGPLSTVASRLFTRLLAWSEAQFWLAGFTRKQAKTHALHLTSALQGISLVANALGDTDAILTETRFLTGWLGTLSSTQKNGGRA